MANEMMFPDGIGLPNGSAFLPINSLETTLRGVGSAVDNAVVSELAIATALNSLVPITLQENTTGFEISGGSTNNVTLTVTDDVTLDQDLQESASPTFAGLSVGSLDGFVTASSGVLSSQASIGYGDITTGDIETTLTGAAAKLASASAIKSYVDNLVATGISYRPPVDAAFNDGASSLPISTSVTIDGETVINDFRVLVIDSATAGEINKIYKASVSGTAITWTIEQDNTGSDNPVDGHTTWIKAGTNYGDTRYTFNGSDWVQLDTTISYSSGTGIDISSNVISIDPNDTNISMAKLTLTGDLDFSNPAAVTLPDNQLIALSFNSTGAAGILAFVTTNGSEGVSMSGNLDVTGDINGLSLQENATGFSIAGGSTSEKTLTVSEDSTIDQNLQTSATVEFNGLTLDSLSANRLIATDGSKGLTSVTNLTSWVAGTTNRISVGNDGDGSITLSAPQDIHTGANPTFANMTLTGDLTVQGGFKDDDVTTAIPLGDASNDSLSTLFTATSLVGALNELRQNGNNVTSMTTIPASSTTAVQSLDVGSVGGAIWEYTATIGGAVRTGVVIATTAGTNVNTAHQRTQDNGSGNTNDLNVEVNLNGGDLEISFENTDASNAAVVTVIGRPMVVVA